MTRSGSAKRSDSGQKGNIKNFFAKKTEAQEATKEVSADGDASKEKAKSPGHSPGKTSDYESEVTI